MRTRVTAILVAQQGGEWLEETIAGLQAQSFAPSGVLAVNNGGGEQVTEQLMKAGISHVVGLASKLSYGAALAQAVHNISADGDVATTQDWLWLLSEDACPEPHALQLILNSVQRAPSVAVAGPKLVDWDHPDRIIELGQSLTHYGTRWTLRRQELDQQQYDHMQDVLGVGPVGMLVRRDAWDELGGFDPALPVYDDGLDFCVRARLAGHRVEVSPASRVRFAQSGVAGPHIDRRRSVMRTAHRQARTAHLHRRIAYAPAVIAFFAWLGLPLYGVARVLWALIREQPGHMIGEFTAALTVFFRPHAIVRSRRRRKAHMSAGWGSLRSLRVDPKSVRTARMIDREAILASTGRGKREVHFISTGGLAVLIGGCVAAAALLWWAFPMTSVFGGGLAPLNAIDQLWWNTRPLDGVPADPFTWVLAVLGTVTFWNPSHAIVLLLIASIPLTALGGWMWGAQLTQSRAGRALLGIGFALSPTLLGSLAAGALPTLVLTCVLPWLLLACTRCRESWSWAGTASLLAAVALAAAPVLLPAALVLLVVGLCTTWRGFARVLTTALVSVVVFAPKVVTSLIDGRPLNILLDPGIVTPFEPGTTWHLLLGFPEFGLFGWGDAFDAIGLQAFPATLLVGVLLLPLALLSLLGLFTGKVAVTLLHALLGGLGMLTAVGASQLHLTVVDGQSVSLWTGSGLAVYWIAILGLAAVGAETLRRGAASIVAVALVAAMVAVVPVGAQLLLNRTDARPQAEQMPALVQAAGDQDRGIRTLVITPEDLHTVSAELISGSGKRLDRIRTATQGSGVDAADQELADLVGGLASVGGADMRETLQRARVSFVLLTQGSHDAEYAQLQRVFDQHAALASAGLTDQGLLWRVVEPETSGDDEGDANTRLGGTSFSGATIWAVQLAVLLGVLLLALPTGEVTYRPERRKRPSRRRKQVTAAENPTPVPAASAEAPGDEAPHAPETPDAPGVPDAPGSPNVDGLETPGMPAESDGDSGAGDEPDTLEPENGARP